MLILTRKHNEAIYINGEEIQIRVLDISGSQVKLGIDAPKHIKVFRQEVAERIAASNIGVIQDAQQSSANP